MNEVTINSDAVFCYGFIKVSSRLPSKAWNHLKHVTLIAPVAVVAILQPVAAYAYLDPGTGSFILQMLVAGFLAAWLYVRIAWTSTKSFFVRLFSGKHGKETAESADESALDGGSPRDDP